MVATCHYPAALLTPTRPAHTPLLSAKHRAVEPSLILLDLNLPIRNGLDVLAELKSDTDFLSIPVLVLTTSQAPDDIQRCYSLHANAYIIKPPDFDGFADVINQVATCFLGLISLPPQ